jgi:hypothetical protein
MALAFKDALITVNGVNLSSFANNVTLPIEFDELTTTTFGDDAQDRIKGLQDSSITIDLFQSFASSEVDATLWAAFSSDDPVTIAVRPTSGSISATNPEYSASYLVSKYQPFGNKVGEAATTSNTWPLAGGVKVARATS